MHSTREKKNPGVCVCMSRGESEGKKVKVKNAMNFSSPPQQLNSMDYIMISALGVYSFDSIKISTICRNILFLHNHF